MYVFMSRNFISPILFATVESVRAFDSISSVVSLSFPFRIPKVVANAIPTTKTTPTNAMTL